MRAIEDLEIKIKPWLLGKWTGEYRLEVTVHINGEEIHAEQIIVEDQLLSKFEQIWQYAGMKLLDELREKVK